MNAQTQGYSQFCPCLHWFDLCRSHPCWPHLRRLGLWHQPNHQRRPQHRLKFPTGILGLRTSHHTTMNNHSLVLIINVDYITPRTTPLKESHLLNQQMKAKCEESRTLTATKATERTSILPSTLCSHLDNGPTCTMARSNSRPVMSTTMG